LKVVQRKVAQLGNEEFSAFSKVENFSSLKNKRRLIRWCLCSFFQWANNFLLLYDSLKMEAASFSENLVPFYRRKWCQIPHTLVFRFYVMWRK